VDEKHAGILFNSWLLGPYFHDGTKKEEWNYMDSLVISTQYIGTLEQAGNQPPRARFTSRRDWGSMTANFDASRAGDPDGSIASYGWDFGDGASGSGKTAAHEYAKPGDYTVTLTVADGKGQTHAQTLAVTVGPTVGSGDGLQAEYFDGQELAGDPIAVVTARQIAFQRQGWDGRFLWGGVGDNNGDNYSCRWTGFLQPATSEEYTLTYEVNDGGRVWFDGKLVIDAWDKPQTASASVGKLEAGKKYPIRIEHHKGTFDATRDWKAKLSWETPTIAKQLVPPTAFYTQGFVEP
jgi:PKD repeat protein